VALFVGRQDPVFLAIGQTVTRSLPVTVDGAAPTTATGTYRLFDRSGTLLSTESVTAAATPAFAVPSGLDLGGGNYEAWDLTVDGDPLLVQREVFGATSNIDGPLCNSESVLALYPYLTVYPAGWTSWDVLCDVASAQVRADLVTYSRQGADATLFSADRLSSVALHRTCELVWNLQAALTASVASVGQRDYHRREYRDAWERMLLRYDLTGDGPADTAPAYMEMGAQFPRPTPAARR
jgi:hypothetical protein